VRTSRCGATAVPATRPSPWPRFTTPCGRYSAAQGKLHEALEGLLNLEKTARQAEDIAALRAACSAVLAACFSAREWKLLEEHVVLLSKRRGQLRQVIQSFVRQAMGYIDKTPDKATKVSLIKTLQTVTEGKVRGWGCCGCGGGFAGGRGRQRRQRWRRGEWRGGAAPAVPAGMVPTTPLAGRAPALPQQPEPRFHQEGAAFQAAPAP
jgi:hypothetical protein